ncbi:MAG: UDP-N-acetylglucosamine 1-carboxyvinyltransferase [Acidobacteriota bacterium]
MDRFIIEGGIPLRGRAAIRPAKNALLPCLAAALLTKETVELLDSAALGDIVSMLTMLEHLGAEVEGRPGGPLRVRVANGGGDLEAPYDLVRKMRASVLVLGPMVARYGRARVSLPGGCAIGARPIDQHLKGLAALGAEVRVDHGYVEVRASKLRGGDVLFDRATVTGTENLLMAATLAGGTTTLRNAAREPEIIDLAELLAAMGARIEGAGTDTIQVKGVEGLHGARHACIPDRIEAGTLLMAGCITGGDVTCAPAVPAHLEALLAKLREMGAEVATGDGWIRAASPNGLASADVVTAAFPGFPTDLQAQFMALATRTRGASTVKETIFENRFMHVPELMRMGAEVSVEGNVAIVKGPTRLTGAPVMASDLRASAGLVLAGLCADGCTEVRRIYHLDRGYEQLEERLSALGAAVRRVGEEEK